MPDDNVEPHMSSETPPPRPPSNTEPPVEAKQEVEAPLTLPPDSSAQPVLEAVAAPEVQSLVTKDVPSPPSATATSATTAAAAATATAPPDEIESKADAKVGDTVDAPIGPSSSLQNTAIEMEETKSAAPKSVAEKEDEKEKPVELEEVEQVVSAKSNPAAEAAAALEPVEQAPEEAATEVAPAVGQPPRSEAEPAEAQTQCPAPVAETESQPDPTPTETTQRPLYNGLPQDTDEELTEGALSDTTPPSKPEAALSQEFTTVAKTAAIASQELQNEEENHEESDSAAPSREDSTTMQGRPLFPR